MCTVRAACNEADAMFNKTIDGSNVVGAHACRHEHEQQQLGQMPVPMVVHGQGLVERRRELLQSWHQQRCCDDTADEERGATSPLIDVVVRLLPPVDDMSMENAEERFSHTAGCVYPPLPQDAFGGPHHVLVRLLTDLRPRCIARPLSL